MNNQDPQQKSNKKGFGVEASPFNTVKLELGFVIIFGIVLWIGVDFITPSTGKQLLLLASYGFISALWLMFRTRRVFQHHQSEDE